MNLTIFIGPNPSANLTELFRRTPIGSGSICALVPNSQSVTAMERRLVSEDREAFIGHRVYTLEGLTRAILSLAASVPETLSNHIKQALIAEIIKSRIGKQSRFRNVSGFPGFVKILVSFLEDIRSTIDGVVTRDSELLSIETAYQIHLNRLGVTDHEGMVKLALKSGMVERFAQSFKGPLIVDGFYDLTDMQLELISMLFKVFGRSAVTLVYDSKRPSLFALPERLISEYTSLGAKIVEVEAHSSTGPDFVLSGFMGGDYSVDGEYDDIEIHTFKSETSEADWIAGTIRTMLVRGNYSAEDIMIVSRNTPDFGGVFDNALKRHGIPIENAIARPLKTHSLVKLAIEALDATLNPDEGNILNVQRSCYTFNGSSKEHSLLEIMDDRSWSCMIAEVDSPDGFVSSMKKMLEWLNIRKNLNGGGDRDAAIFEIVVYEKLIEVLDEFAKFYSSFRPMMRSGEFSRLLKLFLGNITIPDRSSPGRGVLLLGTEYARYIKRDVVFFKGLDNSSFPVKHEIHSLHDPEIARNIREHKDLEEGLLFYMAISGAKRLFLTFPGIDDEGKDSSVSPYLGEIQKSIIPSFHSGIPGSAWEGGYVTERGKLENIIRALRDSDDFDLSLLFSLRSCNKEISETVENALNSHIKLNEVHDMNLHTEYTKNILHEEWGDDRVFSVTDLELYISCPVKFFLTRILGLEQKIPIVDGLDPAERGSIIHEILARFYESLQEKTGGTTFSRNELERNTVLMEKIVDKTFLSHTDIVKKLHPVVLSSEKRFIQRWMNYFLELEADCFEESPFYPRFFEVTFGDSTHPPLELFYDGNKIKVKGLIDRIDIANEEGFSCSRVIDYKTGQKTAIKDINEGRALQLPLYIKAVKEKI